MPRATRRVAERRMYLSGATLAPQLPRLALAFGALLLMFLAVRSQVVPKSFGEDGFFRADFVRELRDRPGTFAGKDACMMCHEDIAKVTAHFKAGVSCESCHGPALAHAEDFEKFKPLRTMSREECGRCHSISAAKRKGFPQVDLKEHNPGERCTSCHEIHAKE